MTPYCLKYYYAKQNNWMKLREKMVFSTQRTSMSDTTKCIKRKHRIYSFTLSFQSIGIHFIYIVILLLIKTFLESFYTISWGHILTSKLILTIPNPLCIFYTICSCPLFGNTNYNAKIEWCYHTRNFIKLLQGTREFISLSSQQLHIWRYIDNINIVDSTHSLF